MSDSVEISKLQEREVARLYEIQQDLDPTSVEYEKIHKQIMDICKAYNENSKVEEAYWTADENRKHENKQKNKEIVCKYVEIGLSFAGFLMSGALGLIATWSVIDANQSGGPIYLKDGLEYGKRLLRSTKFRLF